MYYVQRSGGRPVLLKGRFGIFATLAIIFLFIAACGAEGEGSGATEGAATAADLEEAAAGEGELTFYHATAEAETIEWVEPFEEEYGITVNHFRETTPAIFERWDQETIAGQDIADVVLLSDMATWEESIDRDLVADYEPENHDHFPEEDRVDGYFYPLFYYSMTLTWNTEQVDDEEAEMLREQGIEALRDERWEGRIGMGVPHAAGAFFADYHRLVETYGWDLFEDLAAHSPTYYESAVPLMDRLVAGEHSVLPAANDGLSASAVMDGAPIEWVYYDTESTSVPFGLGISANAPNENAARLFAEWATSEEGVRGWVDIRQGIAGHDGVEDGDREIAEMDFYEPPQSLYLDWGVDDEMQAERDDFFAEWSETMGYSP